MPRSVDSDALSSLGRAAQDAGVAAVIGGNLFGRLAMHPALGEVSDERERGKVTNAAWRRYGTVNALGLGAVVAAWAGARLSEARPALLSQQERRLALAKDASVAAVAVTGAALGALGVRFSKAAPGGAVPLADGNTPAPDTPPGAARQKRALNALANANLAAALALLTANASLGQLNFRRPPARRLLKRRY